MDNILTYILNLQGNIDEKLKKIGISNNQQLDTWSKVQKQVSAANVTMNSMGKTIGSMNEKITALRMQKEWIPASNTEAIRTTNKEIKSLEKEITKLNSLNGGRLSKWWGELKSTMPFQMMTNPIVAATIAIRKFNQYLGESVKLYEAQAVAEKKLETLMRNNIGASDAEIKSILDLASAQQKLGVIGDEIQLAGAQELSTYLTKADNLKKLIPAMNDMLAQQYGLNTTQEQAVTIAQMMGKVLDGQTGALSRYGYRFDEAQEKILKFGTEEQKVSMLSQILTKYVGGVNAALAATPEGALKQHANVAGDLQERVGKLVVQLRAALLPVKQFFLSIAEGVVWVVENIGIVWNALKKLAPVILGAAAAWATYTIQAKWVAISKGLQTAIAVVTTSLKTATKVLKIFNIAMLKSPLFWIPAVIGGVVAAFTFFSRSQDSAAKLTGNLSAKINTEQRELNRLFDALKKTNPESETRKRLLQEMEEKYPGYLDKQALEKAGEEDLEKARKAANDELARSIYLEDIKEKQGEAKKKIQEREKTLYEKITKLYGGADKMAPQVQEYVNKTFDLIQSEAQNKIDSGEWSEAVFSSYASHGMVSDVFDKVNSVMHMSGTLIDFLNSDIRNLIDEQLKQGHDLKGLKDYGILKGLDTNSSLVALANGGKTTPTTNPVAGTSEAIATGGTRSTTINISLKNMMEAHFNGTIKENAREVERDMAEIMYRILGMAETAN
jgi:hypothetical protein